MELNYEFLARHVAQIARQVGAYIARERLDFSATAIEYKGTQNLVSYVDRTAEELLKKELMALLPSAEFVAEESYDPALAQAVRQEGKVAWVVDPLDGTTNFTHDMAPYCVSIALVEGKRPVVGVVYEITRDECFVAWHGGPCLLNDRPVRVSTVDSIERSLVVTGLAYKKAEAIDAFDRTFRYFNLHSNGARRLGSAAADLAYVAAGRAECFYHTHLGPWDIAGGALLVQCAGGQVTDWTGEDDYIFSGNVIATNGTTHDDFTKILNDLR